MFKKNYDHLPKEIYFGMYKEATRGNPNYFLTYGNGKSAARIQDNLRPNGAHRWHNYMKSPKYCYFITFVFIFLLDCIILYHGFMKRHKAFFDGELFFANFPVVIETFWPSNLLKIHLTSCLYVSFLLRSNKLFLAIA
jgi:hypothetical protein